VRFQSAFQTLINSRDVLDAVAGRDIVLILGQSQVGKSTVINALRGVKFQWKAAQGGNSKSEFVPVSPLPQIKLAPMGRGVQRKTQKPEVYEGISGFLTVDTRGVGELGEDQSGILAASVLMEMICKAAKSVQIVTVVSSLQLAEIQNLASVMNQIGNLLPDPTSGVFWLFCRHYATRPGSTPLTKQGEKHILEEMRIDIESAWDNVKDTEVPTDESEPAIIKIFQKSTIIAIREAFNSERVGYIDPTSQWSIQQICDRIPQISPIPVLRMKFGLENQYRSIFEDDLRKLCQRETRFMFTYMLLKPIDPESILDVLDFDDTQEYLEQRRVRINSIEDEVQTMQNHIDSVSSQIQIVYTKSFCASWNFWHWFRTYTVVYPSELRHIPVLFWTKDLERATYLCGVDHSDNPPILRFAAEIWKNCEGRVFYHGSPSMFLR
jgi:hypothetical protein